MGIFKKVEKFRTIFKTVRACNCLNFIPKDQFAVQIQLVRMAIAPALNNFEHIDGLDGNAFRVGADQLPASLCPLACIELQGFTRARMTTLPNGADRLSFLAGFNQRRELLLKIVCGHGCSPLSPLGTFLFAFYRRAAGVLVSPELPPGYYPVDKSRGIEPRSRRCLTSTSEPELNRHFFVSGGAGSSAIFIRDRPVQRNAWVSPVGGGFGSGYSLRPASSALCVPRLPLISAPVRRREQSGGKIRTGGRIRAGHTGAR